MGHTPFGYRIENGKAMIDEQAASQIKTLYASYVTCDSLAAAAKKAGMHSFHASVGKILANSRYIGDAYYPAIVDPDMFTAVQAERRKRAEKLGRLREPKESRVTAFPTAFYLKEATQTFEDPFEQAEYTYSLIETEDARHGSP